MERSNTRGQSTASSNSLLQVMRRHPMFFYFLMAYTFAWLVDFPVVLSHLSVQLAAFLAPLLGPALAGFIMAAIMDGTTGVRRILSGFLQWRVNIPWYLFAILAIPIVSVLGAIILPGVLASFHTPASLSRFGYSYTATFFIGGLIGGPFLEEFGWRGFALPRMQQQLGPLWASALLGLLWGSWHLPLFLSPAFSPGGLNLLNVSEYIVTVIAFTIVMTWVFNNTRGSLFMASLMHASFDTAMDFLVVSLFLAPLAASAFPILIGFGIVALLLIILTRGRLSYDRYQRETALPAPKAIVDQELVAPGKPL